MSPLATPVTCSPNSFQVTSCQAPPRRTRKPVWSPTSATFLASRSVSASSGPTSAVAGTLNSRTPGPLFPRPSEGIVARGPRWGRWVESSRKGLLVSSRVSRRRHGGRRGTASLLPMADQSTQSITIDAPAAEVMAVIADFPSYLQWVAAAKTVEVVDSGDDGRADRVHFVIDAGAVKDDYV